MGILLKMIAFFGGKKGSLTVLVLLSFLTAYITYLKLTNSSLEAENIMKSEKITELRNLANENAAKAKKIKKDLDFQLELQAKSHNQKIKKMKTITVLKERILHETKNNDGNIATVLSDTLHGLQQLQTDSYKNGRNKD